MDPSREKAGKRSLEGFPKRLRRATRVGISIRFLNEDDGSGAWGTGASGELFPSLRCTVVPDKRSLII